MTCLRRDTTECEPEPFTLESRPSLPPRSCRHSRRHQPATALQTTTAQLSQSLQKSYTHLRKHHDDDRARPPLAGASDAQIGGSAGGFIQPGGRRYVIQRSGAGIAVKRARHRRRKRVLGLAPTVRLSSVGQPALLLTGPVLGYLTTPRGWMRHVSSIQLVRRLGSESLAHRISG
jgi:hypothetical protein